VSMLIDEEAEEPGLSDESAECAAVGISFLNVAIPDRSVPSDTNAFLRSVEQLATRVREGRYLAVHYPRQHRTIVSTRRVDTGKAGMGSENSIRRN
jgi:hypothetical protein